MYVCVCIVNFYYTDYVIVVIDCILFLTSVKMSIEADILVDMVLETHPTSPHVDSTASKSQPVRPSAQHRDSCFQEDQQGVSYIIR